MKSMAGVSAHQYPIIFLGALICICIFGRPAQAEQAAHVPPSELMHVCTSDSDAARANCEAFYRGSVERFSVLATDPREAPCRKTALSRDDIKSFLDYAPRNMIPDTAEGFGLILNYLVSSPGLAAHVPCADVPGAWSSSRLLSLCKADFSDGSPCKFYTTALSQAVMVEAIMKQTRYFCPKGDTIRPESETVANFEKWIAGDPSRPDTPAALGFIEAQQQAYPC